MLVDVREDVILEMLQKNMVVHAPKNGKDLKREYPEYDDYPEFTKLDSADLMFVWAWANRTSPFLDIVEEKRCGPCCDFDFKNPHKNTARKEAWGAGTGTAPKFPEEIKNAIRRMELFNPGMRVQMAADNLHLLEQCRKAIRQDITNAEPEEVESYLKTAALARKIQADILKDLEKGNYGSEEVENTMLKNLEGASAAFHKSRA